MNTRSLRVLTVHNRYLQRGGEDVSREAEEQLLRDNGHEVISYVESNTRVAQLGRARLLGRTIWSRESHANITALIRETRPDVMHVQNFFPLISPSVYYAAYTQNVPVVQSLRNYRLFCLNAYFLRDHRVCEDCLGRFLPWPGVYHACYRGSRGASTAVAAMLATHRLAGTWTRRVTRYIALTDFVRQKCIEGGLPSERIMVKPNFILDDPGQGRRARTGAIYVGRLSPEKGIDTLLDGWERSGIQEPLRIVGEGPELARVTERASRNANIQILGSLPQKSVFEYIQAARVLIFPSVWYETFGRTIIEAFAAGTPVVASRLGAAAELVEEERNGFLFTPGDAGELADALNKVMNDPAGRTALGEAARRTFLEKYTAPINYQMLMDIYRSAMFDRESK